jgi:alkane 1-monooxygenase
MSRVGRRSPEAALSASGQTIEPSVWNALPHFIPLLAFPLALLAAAYGGWWFVGPIAFIMLADQFDKLFGLEERNMDPATTSESQLFLYNLSLWIWAALWPPVFIYSLWQMLVADHMAAWEIFLMAGILFTVAQTVFIVGHELVHRRAIWERRLGEFLLGSVSYPHYATEHVYIHHPHVCTPLDPGSAPKGVSFWQYLLPEVSNNVLGAWEFERRRLARRRLPTLHYSNAFWRYGLGLAFWYGLIIWMGGPLAGLIFALLCAGVVISMKLSNYVQHYGLRRIRIPPGRYEPVQPRHAWSAAYKFANWLYYNMQRHADHHTSNRRYPLLQHRGASESPQLPGSYVEMNGLALFPRRWFSKVDPLLDKQRAQFYPEIDDWSAYDSRAFAARPDAFNAIAEIHGASPRLAEWINRSPQLLDRLRDHEFTDLELPEGIGPDPESEAVARRGLARLYWTRELGLSEMSDQLADIPVQDAAEAVETAREWSNGKVFQIAVHVMRGNLSITEAGTALSRVGEASIAAVLSAVEEDFADRGAPRTTGGVAVAIDGPIAVGGAMPGERLKVRLVYDGGPHKHYRAICRRFAKALRALSQENLLLAPLQGGDVGELSSFTEFEEQLRKCVAGGVLLTLAQSRCVFVYGDSHMGDRFDNSLRDCLARRPARDVLLARLSEVSGGGEPEPGPFDSSADGRRNLTHAALILQIQTGSERTAAIGSDPATVFEAAADRGLIGGDTALRLSTTAALWRNLHGSLRIIAGDGFSIESATSKVKSAIAEACGQPDFAALMAAVPEAASDSVADLAELVENLHHSDAT